MRVLCVFCALHARAWKSNARNGRQHRERHEAIRMEPVKETRFRKHPCMGRKETARAHRLLYRKRKSNIKQFKKGIPRHTPFHLRREERRTRTKNRSDLLAPEIEQQKIESGTGRQ